MGSRSSRSKSLVKGPKKKVSSSNPCFGSDVTVEYVTSYPNISPNSNRGWNWQTRQSNNEAAQWRLRVTTRNNIYQRLRSLGVVAPVAAGSLLMWGKFPYNTMFESFSSWKQTIKESAVYGALTEHQRGALMRAPRDRYERIESAIQSFGQMVCLGLEDLNDPELFRSFSMFKIWAIGHGIRESTQDMVLEVIKFLSKICQAIFLDSDRPEMPTGTQVVNGMILPFCGPLSFISDLYFGRRDRSQGFSLEEARTLAQIGSTGRALPYPSSQQIRRSVEETLSIITTESEQISKRVLKKHRTLLLHYVRQIRPNDIERRTHMSLSNSGAYECTREEGGRAGYLTSHAKLASEISVDKTVLSWISGRVDCFGEVVGDPTTCKYAERLLEAKPDLVMLLGDLLYCKSDELLESLQERKKNEVVVPRHLAKLLANVSALDMLKFGHYDNVHEVRYGLLTFSPELTGKYSRFRMDRKSIPVRASLSIEAGMKTRLVTSAPAAITQLGQLIGNKAREYLSRDPFMRVGFQENDKLWEVLKAYRHKYERKMSKVDDLST